MRTLPALLLSVAAIAGASGASAQDFPKLKPGQWEITTSTTPLGSPAKAGAKVSAPAKSTMCTDEAMQKQLIEMGAGMRKEMCAKSEFKRDGSRIVTTAECKVGESTIRSRTVMTLTGDTAYRTEIAATYTPAFMGMTETRTTIDGKYSGACRDGLKPGDLVTAGGRKINIRGVMSGKMPVLSK